MDITKSLHHLKMVTLELSSNQFLYNRRKKLHPLLTKFISHLPLEK